MRESLREAPPLSGLLNSNMVVASPMGNNNLKRCADCMTALAENSIIDEFDIVLCFVCENYVSEVV